MVNPGSASYSYTSVAYLRDILYTLHSTIEPRLVVHRSTSQAAHKLIR